MRIKFNKSLSFKRRSKTLRKKRKDFENEIKEIIGNSLMAQNNNKELAQKNVTLLAEIEVLKKDKLDLCLDNRRLIFRQNPNQMMIKNELMVLLETLKSEHKKFVQMFETTNNFYTQMIHTISARIEEFIKFEGNTNFNNVSNEDEVTTTEKPVNCHQIYEMRQLDRQNSPNEAFVDTNGRNLSLIQEVSNTQNITKDSEYTSVESQLQTPIIKSQCMRSSSSVTDYEMTPHFSNQNLRTPSIYNFDCNSLGALRYAVLNESQETSVSPFDMSLRPELNLSGFDSFNTTLTEASHSAPHHTSTPNGLTGIETIRRPSKRISSINRPYSPRIGRQSLNDIQNVIENKKSRKHSVLSTDCRTKTNEMIESQTNGTNDTISLNITKKEKKRKKCDTITLDSDTSEISGNSDHSTRSSRRNKKPVSYKEPSLHSKIRRPLK